jgi:hypothetical protein
MLLLTEAPLSTLLGFVMGLSATFEVLRSGIGKIYSKQYGVNMIHGFHHTSFTVSDVDAAERFFVDVMSTRSISMRWPPTTAQR